MRRGVVEGGSRTGVEMRVAAKEGEGRSRTEQREGQAKSKPTAGGPGQNRKTKIEHQNKRDLSQVASRDASGRVPGRVPRRPGAGVSRRPGTPRDASWQRSGGFPASAVDARRHEPSGAHHALRRGPIAARRERNGRTQTKPCTHQAAATPHSIPTASAQDRRQVALKARAGERVPRPCFARGRGCGAIPKTISQGRVALGHHRRHADRPTLRPPPAIASNARRTAGPAGTTPR